MRISEERVAIVAKGIVNNLLDEELVDLEISEDQFTFLIESLIVKDLKVEDEIDELASTFLLKHKSYLQEGSTEWEIAMDQQREKLAIDRGYIIR